MLRRMQEKGTALFGGFREKGCCFKRNRILFNEYLCGKSSADSGGYGGIAADFPICIYALWLPVAIRLLMPGMPVDSPLSIMHTGVWERGSTLFNEENDRQKTNTGKSSTGNIRNRQRLFLPYSTNGIRKETYEKEDGKYSKKPKGWHSCNAYYDLLLHRLYLYGENRRRNRTDKLLVKQIFNL